MNIRSMVCAAVLLLVGSPAFADLEPWTDYEYSENVWSITTIKVHSNMGDAYLEGIRGTWVPAMESLKKLGHIEDYFVYQSELPESGDFNLMLVVRFENSEMTEPNKERYQAFMADYGKAQADQATEYAQKNYPAMREITGEYRIRRIDFK